MMVRRFATLPRKNVRKNAIPNSECLLATALYDNVAETPDELAFCKGDILVVLEQNPNNLVGWWCCSLRGRIGICPGNRLRMLGHVVSPPGSASSSSNAVSSPPLSSSSPNQPRHVRQASDPLRNFVPPVGISATKDGRVPTLNKAGSRELVDCKLQCASPTLKKQDQSYDVPTGHLALADHPGMTYDTPRSHSFAPLASSASSGRHGESQPLKDATYDIPKGAEESYDIPKCQSSCQRHSAGDLPGTLDYDVPKHYHGFSQKKESVTPGLTPKCAAAAADLAYDVPPPRVNDSLMLGRSGCGSMSSSSSPSPSQSATSLTPSLSLSSLGGNSSSNRSSLEHPAELYDIPRPTNTCQDTYDVPAPVDTATWISNNTNSGQVPGENVYDVPPQVTRDNPICGSDTLVCDSSATIQSSPSLDSQSSSSTTAKPIEGKELPLELDAAMDMLVKLQQSTQMATQKLFNSVNSLRLKGRNQSTTTPYDLHLACTEVRVSSQEFLDFANGALVNSSKGVDPAVFQRLSKLLRPLRDANLIVRDTCTTLESRSYMVLPDERLPDDLERLVACARTLMEDVRQVACFIQGNSTLIFKRAKPTVCSKVSSPDSGITETTMSPGSTVSPAPIALPPKTRERPLPWPPGEDPASGNVKPATKDGEGVGDENLYENDGHDWVDDYDYVNLESKEIFQKKNEEIKASLPEDMRKSFDNIIQQSLVQVDDSLKGRVDRGISSSLSPADLLVKTDIRLDANDRQVLNFYLAQLETHGVYLNNAIEAFLLTMERNQPPKIFVDHGKFVILGAHKLVYIGDTVHRNVSHPELRRLAQRCADKLCDSLKIMVQRIKTAAIQFPSVTAVEKMVESVVTVSQEACNLKHTIAQFAKS